VKPFCHPEGRINIDIVRRLLGPKKNKEIVGQRKIKYMSGFVILGLAKCH